MALVDSAIREVVERHDAFVTWFTGRGDDSVYADMELVFAPGFVLISPDASVADRHAVMTMLAGARGARPADFEITVSDAKAMWSTADAVVIAYIEHQVLAGQRTKRQSTALFTREPAAPNGVVWQHVHETWITPPN
ncbi:MAG: hypothetical protein AAGF49_07225, partial [Pseudomonadota bacterium]